MNKKKVFFASVLLLSFLIVLLFLFYKGYSHFSYVHAEKEMQERILAKAQDTERSQITNVAKSLEGELLEPTKIAKGTKLEGEKYILLLGLDTRSNDFLGRSDSMIVLKLSRSTGEMKLVSIPRDSYVNIAGKDVHDKITHAYAFGGKETSKETVEELFGIEIDNTVVINFRSFEKVVDILGGVEVDSPLDFTEQGINSKEKIHIKKGKQTLSGKEALAYARMRHDDPQGDYGRGQRQQEVIESLLKSVKNIDSLTQVISLFKTVNDEVDSDVSLTDVKDYFPYLKTLGREDRTVEKYQLKGNGTRIDGIYYEEVDSDSLNEIRSKFSGKSENFLKLEEMAKEKVKKQSEEQTVEETETDTTTDSSNDTSIDELEITTP